MKCKLCGQVLDEFDYADHCAEGMSVLDTNAAERYSDACIQRAIARRASHKEAIQSLLDLIEQGKAISFMDRVRIIDNASQVSKNL